MRVTNIGIPHKGNDSSSQALIAVQITLAQGLRYCIYPAIFQLKRPSQDIDNYTPPARLTHTQHIFTNILILSLCTSICNTRYMLFTAELLSVYPSNHLVSS